MSERDGVTRMGEQGKHIVVVGGGISGLSAAFYLHQAIRENDLPHKVTLVEASDRLGGVIRSEVRDGFVMERGPDSFLERKKSGVELVRALGLQDELVRNATGQSYLLHSDRLLPIPEGAVMGVPTKLAPFVTTPLVSPLGKLRAAGDLLLPRTPLQGDQSVGAFFRRRLGNEVVDRIIAPLLSGVYSTDIDHLSLQATFPQFQQMEKKYRSLIVGMKNSRKRGITGSVRSVQSNVRGDQVHPDKAQTRNGRGQAASEQQPTPRDRHRKPQGAFLTLRGGLQSLVTALEEALPTTTVEKNRQLERIEKVGQRYFLSFRDGQKVTADAIVMSVPHHVTYKALGNTSFLQPLPGTNPASAANVVVAYRADRVRIAQEGTGFIVPRTETAYTITASTWVHKKWPHMAPPGYALLRCFLGRAEDATIVDAADDDIVQTALGDLRRVITLNGEPEFSVVTRWKNARPQYAVGHPAWLARLKSDMRQHFPGVELAGASYDGSGLPDCIAQGKRAAETALQFVGSR